MLIPKSSAEALNNYLLKEVPQASEADPSVLSRYIISVLEHDDLSYEDAKAKLNTELTDFVKEGTEKFVEKLIAGFHEQDDGYHFEDPDEPSHPRRDRSPSPYSGERVERGQEQMTDEVTTEIEEEIAIAEITEIIEITDRAIDREIDREIVTEEIDTTTVVDHHAGADSNGFCSKGAECPYEHSEENQDETSDRKESQYDPEKPLYDEEDKTRFDSRKRLRSRDGRGDRSEDEDHPDNTTVVVLQIPDHLNTAEGLFNHFKQFGPIVQTKPRLDGNKAYVQYENHADAIKALESPEAVLGNRFIKVFWAKRPENKPNNHPNYNQPNQAPPHYHQQPHHPPAPVQLPPRAAMQLTNKPPPSSTTQKSEKDKELLRVKEEKRRHQLEQTKLLLDQISKVKDPTAKAELVTKLNQLTNTVAESIAKDSQSMKVPEKEEKKEENVSERERLQKRLESLTNIATNMGINVGDNGQTTTMATPAPLYGTPTSGYVRGGYGGGYRGRGRGGRGGHIGMTLDNRTTSLRIQPVPEDLTEGETLLNHLKTFGEVTSSHLNGNIMTVQYKNRKSAEMALNKGKTINGHTLPMKWHENSNTMQSGGAMEIDNVPVFTVAGFVKNAVNNQILSNVPVSLLGSSNSSTTSDDRSRQLAASLDGFSDILKTIDVQDDIQVGRTADLSMSPIVVDKTVRAVLEWGVYPIDLDGHYYTDTCEIYSINCDHYNGCQNGTNYFHHRQRCSTPFWNVFTVNGSQPTQIDQLKMQSHSIQNTFVSKSLTRVVLLHKVRTSS
ncbi:second mitotic wave missing-like [Planoprotostelium fungivorum]|uniref:Second mitotic wave missing-like n=1 Tax=Planoprotostelium fungivorum TaxID=1890364 RepID=A0A2P6NEC9_9EUKA|nr:second mitotic wave missing-like [Planoprotostelium fungivorum]